jgi:hypothetical protein
MAHEIRRQAGARTDTEIAVTPEMIAAGKRVLEEETADDFLYPGATFRDDLVEKVFRSMLAVAKVPR